MPTVSQDKIKEIESKIYKKPLQPVDEYTHMINYIEETFSDVAPLKRILEDSIKYWRDAKMTSAAYYTILNNLYVLALSANNKK